MGCFPFPEQRRTRGSPKIELLRNGIGFPAVFLCRKVVHLTQWRPTVIDRTDAHSIKNKFNFESVGNYGCKVGERDVTYNSRGVSK